MKIVIIGPGALGSLFAALLAAEKKNDVWLLDHNAERAAKIHGNLLFTEGEQEVCRLVSATADAEKIGPADLVLHCVKSRDVSSALLHATPLFSSHTTLITFQNGIGHLETLENMKLPMVPAVGVTAMGATLKKTGHVCHGGQGLTRIGFARSVSDKQDKALDKVVALFNRVGLQTEKVDNIIDVVWSKLLINVGINALTVIFNCENGKLLDSDKARNTLVQAVKEGQDVARALGISISGDPVANTLAVCRATANNISSMLQDARRKRPTEIDSINGALLKKADEAGIKAPVNRELVRQVREIEAGYLRTAPGASFPGHP